MYSLDCVQHHRVATKHRERQRRELRQQIHEDFLRRGIKQSHRVLVNDRCDFGTQFDGRYYYCGGGGEMQIDVDPSTTTLSFVVGCVVNLVTIGVAIRIILVTIHTYQGDRAEEFWHGAGKQKCPSSIDPELPANEYIELCSCLLGDVSHRELVSLALWRQ